jgi:transcriptional regulator with XRE-family HTH domain
LYHARLPAAFRVTTYSREATAIERIFFANLVRRLVARRLELGMTQEDLDYALGVSEGLVAKWESFARFPGAFMFVCWSNRLGLELTVQPEIPAIETRQKAAA